MTYESGIIIFGKASCSCLCKVCSHVSEPLTLAMCILFLCNNNSFTGSSSRSTHFISLFLRFRGSFTFHRLISSALGSMRRHPQTALFTWTSVLHRGHTLVPFSDALRLQSIGQNTKPFIQGRHRKTQLQFRRQRRVPARDKRRLCTRMRIDMRVHVRQNGRSVW